VWEDNEHREEKLMALQFNTATEKADQSWLADCSQKEIAAYIRDLLRGAEDMARAKSLTHLSHCLAKAYEAADAAYDLSGVPTTFHKDSVLPQRRAGR
jgi:hypothetical protein